MLGAARVEVEPCHQQGIYLSPEASLIEPIPPESVIERLELAGSPKLLLNSLRGSLWGKISNTTILLEARTWSAVQQARVGAVTICDFDDCLMSATGWHRKEYELVEQDESLHQRGVDISAARAREIYELSKMHIPGIAEKEPRYTPRLNLVLLSIYADTLSAMQSQEQTGGSTAWDELLSWHQMITGQVQTLGERALNAYAVDPAVKRIFMGNSAAGFLYSEFVQDVFDCTSPTDLRIVATRGKIEGPLGQVYKMHTSGLMRERSWAGQGVDLVVYSNDVKAEALIHMMKVLPGIDRRRISIYDDNPNEVLPYLKVIQNLGAPNIEVIQVSHPDAKRKDMRVGIEPRLVYQRRETWLRHYSPLSAFSQTPVLAPALS